MENDFVLDFLGTFGIFLLYLVYMMTKKQKDGG
jgi:hypothetical protein